MIASTPSSGRESHRTVGISDLAVSRDPHEMLVTHSLGSCLGLSLYDARAGVAGLLHCMLPESSMDPVKARRCPAMFTDTGVQALVEAMLANGAHPRSLVAKVAGGATVFDDRGMFRIGERNHASLRRVLWRNEILIAAEDIGGTRPRTMYVAVATGRVVLRTGMDLVEL